MLNEVHAGRRNFLYIADCWAGKKVWKVFKLCEAFLKTLKFCDWLKLHPQEANVPERALSPVT